MKKYEEILKEISETSEKILAANLQEDKLVDTYMSFSEWKERAEARKNVENDIVKLNEEKSDLTLAIKILRHNAKVALFNEVIPVALKILEKYKGKPYGEKTRQKICNEVNAATGCRFYINTNKINIYGNADDITCGTNDRVPFLIDNKIQIVDFSEISLWYEKNEYVEDIPKRIEELKAAYIAAYEMQNELEKACSKYNDLAVGDIAYIRFERRIYKNADVYIK